MDFIHLKKQYFLISDGIEKRFKNIMENTRFIMGAEVREMEQILADYVNVKHCISCSNGTDALLLAMMALNIQPGDQVITTPFSFYATTEMITLLNAEPVFVDIDPKTYNLDPQKLEAAITDKTRAIMPVSLYGQPADFKAINLIAAKYNLPVIEDGAQSFGSEHHGKKSGGLSTIGCTSFFPSKPLGCYGDGGACFTDDDDLAEKMRSIRVHGQQGRYNHVRKGLNARMDTLQAAVIIEKMTLFRGEVESRQRVASKYSECLEDICRKPIIQPENLSVYGQYTIEVDNRSGFCAALKDKGIPTAVHYPKSLHEQPWIAGLKDWNSFPISESAASRVVSLPFHPYMSESDIKIVCREVKECLSITA